MTPRKISKNSLERYISPTHIRTIASGCITEPGRELSSNPPRNVINDSNVAGINISIAAGDNKFWGPWKSYAGIVFKTPIFRLSSVPLAGRNGRFLRLIRRMSSLQKRRGLEQDSLSNWRLIPRLGEFLARRMKMSAGLRLLVCSAS